jgi:hypothetical protein
MWRGAQDQKIRQPNPMSNSNDENELTDAKGVPLSRLVRLLLRIGSIHTIVIATATLKT